MAKKDEVADVISDESKNADPKDERDTNTLPLSQSVGQLASDTKVQVLYPDGSAEEATVGELAETHGDPMGGPSVADLNPAFAPSASTHAGAQDS